MPRIEFDAFKDAEPWLNKFIKNSDKGFVAYHTKDSELVLIPSRSTQPIVLGYVRKCSDKEAKEFSISSHIDLYKISRFEFNSDRALPTNEVII